MKAAARKIRFVAKIAALHLAIPVNYKHRGISQCRDLNELDRFFRARLEVFLSDCKKAGLDPIVIETYRTQERQEMLYKYGREKPYLDRAKVTDTLHSAHTQRLAADVCPRTNGKIDWDRKDLFDRMGRIAKEHGLKWGGDFPDYDGAHIQDKRFDLILHPRP